MTRIARDELEIGEPLVRRRLDEQFSQWADLQLRPLDPTGKTSTPTPTSSKACGWASPCRHRSHRWRVPSVVLIDFRSDPDETGRRNSDRAMRQHRRWREAV
jgi:hypothetical protein